MSNAVSRSGLRLISISTMLAGLAACGGGSSSDSGCGTCSGALPTAPVTITQANAPQVAGAAFDTLTGGTSVPLAAQTSASASALSVSTVAHTIAKIGQASVQQMLSQGATTATVTGAVTTTNCLVSGTKSVDNTSSTSGSVVYNNCSDIAGETKNGTVSMSNIVSSASSFSADVVFNNMTITTTSPANTETIEGDVQLYMDLNTMAMSMSGTSLSIANTDGRGNFGLQNYTIAIDGTGTPTTLTFTFASTAIGGTAVFAMTAPLSGNGYFPSSGAATITGASSTKLKLTVLGDESAPVGSQVMLELSTDNGATYAAPTYETWANISSSI